MRHFEVTDISHGKELYLLRHSNTEMIKKKKEGSTKDKTKRNEKEKGKKLLGFVDLEQFRSQ